MDKIMDSLGPSEKTLFNRVLKCYEQKDFKKGLKLCKSILSKPRSKDHAETLALLGMFTASTGNQQEGYNLCKKALTKDIKSYMSWHILGVIEKERRNYSSSLSCFVTANKLNAKNYQILKDKALLEFQCNELSGHLETYKILYGVANKNTNTTFGLAYAYYLLKQYNVSFEVLQNMRLFYDHKMSRYVNPNEINYMTIFEVHLLMKMEQYCRALDHMDAHKLAIFDLVKMIEFQTECHYELKNKSESLYGCMKLIVLNPNCDKYYDWAIRLLNRDDVVLQFLEQLYQSISDSFYLKYLLLKYSGGEKFAEYLNQFTKLWLKMKTPGAMRFVWPAVKDSAEKQNAVRELLASLTSEFWSNYFISSFNLCSHKYELALKYAIQCYKIDSSNPDGLILLATCYRKIGNFDVARGLSVRASNLCIGDRYTNSIAGKYSFYQKDVKVSDDLLKRFNKVDQTINDYMKDIQCIWYRLEKMKHFFRNSNIFVALHHMKIALSFHSQFIFDKLDYYHYSIRQMFILSHERCLNMEMYIMNTELYFKTYLYSLKIYIALFMKMEEQELLKGSVAEQPVKGKKVPVNANLVKCCSDCGNISKIVCVPKIKEMYSGDKWQTIVTKEMMVICEKLLRYRSENEKTHKVAAIALLLGGNFNKAYSSLMIVIQKCNIISSAIVEASFLRRALKNVLLLTKEDVEVLCTHIGFKEFNEESVKNYVKNKPFDESTPMIVKMLIRISMSLELKFDTTAEMNEMLVQLDKECQIDMQDARMILKKVCIQYKPIQEALNEYFMKHFPDTVIKYGEFMNRNNSILKLEN